MNCNQSDIFPYAMSFFSVSRFSDTYGLTLLRNFSGNFLYWISSMSSINKYVSINLIKMKIIVKCKIGDYSCLWCIWISLDFRGDTQKIIGFSNYFKKIIKGQRKTQGNGSNPATSPFIQVYVNYVHCLNLFQVSFETHIMNWDTFLLRQMHYVICYMKILKWPPLYF